MKQKTLRKNYSFEGKGLHTGCYVRMSVCPAPAGSGIVFVRTDLGDAEIPALAENVSSTKRSTTISCGKASVRTIEHILSALTGLDVDNARIELDGPEVPILDGSARLYVESILPDGLEEQDAERVWLELDGPLEFSDPQKGSYVKIVPAEEPSFDVTIDFNSRVLGVQSVHWDRSVDYSSEVAPCRTFCFLHEIWLLSLLGMVKGGDVENAIVIVEKPVGERKLDLLARRFRQPRLSVTPEGYLSNLVLRFPDECGRHKLLDIIGDLRLCGGFMNARVEAYKSGHRLNTGLAKLVRQNIKDNNG